ncbi:hypothetical protein PCCS19_21480 [Paenibacillus sp. CCS19]|nr:hypothetical protein PCCS19_21480 [Paenibacillus cellulosilyticus]
MMITTLSMSFVDYCLQKAGEKTPIGEYLQDGCTIPKVTPRSNNQPEKYWRIQKY